MKVGLLKIGCALYGRTRQLFILETKGNLRTDERTNAISDNDSPSSFLFRQIAGYRLLPHTTFSSPLTAQVRIEKLCVDRPRKSGDIRHEKSCQKGHQRIPDITHLQPVHLSPNFTPSVSTHSTFSCQFHSFSCFPSTPVLPLKPQPTTRKISYLRENAPPLPTSYANSLQKHHLYQLELDTLEAHRARHHARVHIFRW